MAVMTEMAVSDFDVRVSDYGNDSDDGNNDNDGHWTVIGDHCNRDNAIWMVLLPVMVGWR